MIERHMGVDGTVVFSAGTVGATRDQKARWEAKMEREWAERQRFRSNFLSAVHRIQFDAWLDSL